jgi:hypothetical protein
MSEQIGGETTLAEGLVPEEEASFVGRALHSALRAAWLAVLLGIGVQSLVVASRLLAGGTSSPMAFIASLGQGITWSVLVCAGVAVGTVVGRANSLTLGIIGFIAGPAAWGLAKGTQKALQGLMGLPQDRLDTFFLMITGLKGIEYAILGAALGYMVGKPWARLPAFAGLGVASGAVFAAIVIVLTMNHGPAKLPALIATGVNEIVFPIGCSLVIYAVLRLREHVTRLAAPHEAPSPGGIGPTTA